MKSKKWIFLTILFLILLISAYFIYARYKSVYQSGKVMVASVSSDGNYAITTDLSRKAILWNLKNHTKKILDRKANIYSAYFIKNSNNFMWQHDLNNEVIIENVSGKIIKKFNPGFPTYGQLISKDLKTYIASDEDWNVFMIRGDHKKQIMKDDGGFFGGGKLLNFSISPNEKYLLTSGLGITNLPADPIRQGVLQNLDGVTLWNYQTGDALKQYFGNMSKTFATLSPDGKYVVAGDEGGGAFVWQTFSGKRLFGLYSLEFGYIVNPDAPIEKQKWNKDGLIKQPADFKSYNGVSMDSVFSFKFIDDTHYLYFTTYVPNYAILYSVTDPKPLKYLPLGKSPMISVDRYTRDQSIDTSPQAQVLVTGKINQGGILVYKYDPKTQTLKKIWNGQ